jgi:hypothetical protein
VFNFRDVAKVLCSSSVGWGHGRGVVLVRKGSIVS